jgi:thiamine pyrophosphate-dependent acetolactate synthase large subunit-like protein
MPTHHSQPPSPLGTIDRRAFVAELLSHTPEALVVTGLGSATYDVFASGDSDRYFYLWGAMGGALPIGLGLALAQPQRQVLVVTGDGEQLMGMGALATAAAQQPANLSVVVLDNGHFGETGMQRSHTSLGTRLIEVAKACGVARTREIFQMAETRALAQDIGMKTGFLFAQVHIKQEDLPRQLPTRDGTFLKNRLRSHLGLAPV